VRSIERKFPGGKEQRAPPKGALRRGRFDEAKKCCREDELLRQTGLEENVRSTAKRLIDPTAVWFKYKEMFMKVRRIRDEGQTLTVPTGKVLGIVDTRDEFEGLARALNNAGFDKIEALCGEEGVSLLERVDNFFFSDMEDRVLKRHLDELKAGHIIITIQAPADRVDEAASVAAQNGARRLVHFGQWQITWLTK
jgi:hypothetical protein